ncbi:MAG: hypothetical protein R2747_07065 [Pyrinomonadaceae bacterium]
MQKKQKDFSRPKERCFCFAGPQPCFEFVYSGVVGIFDFIIRENFYKDVHRKKLAIDRSGAGRGGGLLVDLVSDVIQPVLLP